MNYTVTQIEDWIPEFIKAGFTDCLEKDSTAQSRGKEYKFKHSKLINFLGLSVSSAQPGYFYLKNFSNNGEPYLGFGLNAQTKAGKALQDKSGIIANANDTHKGGGQYCWKDENLADLLTWISRI